MIDGISIMVCIYIVFRVIERVIVVSGDSDTPAASRVSLVVIGLVAGYLSVSVAMNTHVIALDTEKATAQAQKDQQAAFQEAQQQQQIVQEEAQRAQAEALEQLRQLGQ